MKNQEIKLTLTELNVFSFKITKEKIVGGEGTHVSCKFIDGECVNEMIDKRYIPFKLD